MKNILTTAFLTSILLTSAHGTVTLNFNSAFVGGVSSNFADAAGTVTNGMFWGVIVDTDNTGFFTTYDPFIVSANSVTILGNNGSASTNVLITSADLTQDTSGFAEGDFITSGGPGGITAVADAALANGVSTGDVFRIVWFDPSNTQAGFLDDATFVIPADGAGVDYDSPFVGSRSSSSCYWYNPRPRTFYFPPQRLWCSRPSSPQTLVAERRIDFGGASFGSPFFFFSDSQGQIVRRRHSAHMDRPYAKPY